MEELERKNVEPQESRASASTSTKMDKSSTEQLIHAKKLLQGDSNSDKFAAIYCLVKASRLGNEEATDLLAQCLDEGRGISADNKQEVISCLKLKASERERRLKHAIQKLFGTIKKEGEEKIRSEDINDALQKAKEKIEKGGDGDQGSPEDPKGLMGEIGLMSLLSNALSVGHKEEVTVHELIDTATSYAKGEVPELVVLLSKEEMAEYNKSSYIEKLMRFPHQSAESLKHFVLVKISKQGSTWVKSLIPAPQLQMLLILYVYNQLTAEFLMFLFPLVAFYISFIAMVVFSLQMFYGRQALKQLKSVSGLIRKFDPLMDENEVERQFMWRSIWPYMSFFIALILTVLVLPLVDNAWIPWSELCLVSLFFTASAFRGLPSEYDDFALYTIILKVLTSCLYSLDKIPGLWLLTYKFIAISLPNGLEFNISIPAILHLVILGMLVVMGGRHSWRGLYKVLIPHLVCLLWWQTFTELFQNTTWSGLIRAAVGWIIFATMLPFIFIFILGIFLASFFQWFSTLELTVKLAMTALAIASSAVVLFYSNIKLPSEKLKKKPIIAAVVVVVVCLLVPIIYVHYVPTPLRRSKTISWDSYNELCGPEAQAKNNEAALQIACTELTGDSVLWEGSVTSVKVAVVENRFRSVVNNIPRFVRPTAKCLLGGDENENDREERISWLGRKKRSCNLKKYDKYTFTVGLRVPPEANSTQAVNLAVGHRYYHHILQLQQGTRLQFKASLQGGMGSPVVTASLQSLFMDGKRVRPQVGLDKVTVYGKLLSAARYSAQFFLSPVLVPRELTEEEEDSD